MYHYHIVNLLKIHLNKYHHYYIQLCLGHVAEIVAMSHCIVLYHHIRWVCSSICLSHVVVLAKTIPNTQSHQQTLKYHYRIVNHFTNHLHRYPHSHIGKCHSHVLISRLSFLNTYHHCLRLSIFYVYCTLRMTYRYINFCIYYY